MKFYLSGKCKIKPRREEHSLYSIKWHYLACRHYCKQRGLIVPETERQNHRQICTLHLWDGTKFIPGSCNLNSVGNKVELLGIWTRVSWRERDVVLSQKVIRRRILEIQWEHHLSTQLPFISVNSSLSADVFLLPDFTQKHNFQSCLPRSHHKQRLHQELLTVPSIKAYQIPRVITYHQKFRPSRSHFKQVGI